MPYIIRRVVRARVLLGLAALSAAFILPREAFGQG
jgi:hypothetical protein